VANQTKIYCKTQSYTWIIDIVPVKNFGLWTLAVDLTLGVWTMYIHGLVS